MSIYRIVTYVVRDRPEFGLMPGYVILGLREPCQHESYGGLVDHRLKAWPEFYRAVRDKIKTFEIRKDDREPRYAVGQMLELVYFDPGVVGVESKESTGGECRPGHSCGAPDCDADVACDDDGLDARAFCVGCGAGPGQACHELCTAPRGKEK